jgi:RNA polymerase sigma factor (sigma-70 family)
MNEVEKLYREGFDKYVRIIKKVLHDDLSLSQDIVQEAFLRAFKSYPTYNPELSGIKSWFSRILFNELSRALGKEKRHKHLSIDRVTRELDPTDYNSIIEDAISVEGVLEDNFNLKQRVVVLLIYYRGYKISEVSGMLSVTESYVKKTCHQFRKTMRK